METLIESIRWTTTVFAVVTAVAMLRALQSAGRLVLGWLVLASAAGLFLTHGLRGLPAPVLLPVLASLGVGLGAASLFSAQARAKFDGLDDRQWRMLMSFRAVFGALLLGAGGTGIMPLGFALPAGLGDLAVGALALAAPGSLAAGGNRAVRLFVFGVGVLDFASVVTLLVTVLVPWLRETGSIGISLLLPWVAVPLLATLNLHGLRKALAPA